MTALGKSKAAGGEVITLSAGLTATACKRGKKVMAEHAHSTPTKPTSRRRALFAGVSAVVLGSGITAGAAASIADLVEPDTNPDAELIAAVARAKAAVARGDALTLPFMELSVSDPYYRQHSNAAWKAAQDITVADYHPALAIATELPATTWAGLQAKARLVLLHLGKDDEEEAIGASLARDILAWRA